MLCKEFGFHLAQEFYWWNPSRLPTPAKWVNIRRIRVKDAVKTIFWLSPTPWPNASNRRLLTPYSDSMNRLLANGYKAKRRPSGHEISAKFNKNNGAAISPNLIAVANTESNSRYLKYCETNGLTPHPARFPATIPGCFIRFLTDVTDIVLDPFGGSCVTGEVAERLERRWIIGEIERNYLAGARGRFFDGPVPLFNQKPSMAQTTYTIPRPDLLWNGIIDNPLPSDGGESRPAKPSNRANRQIPLVDID